MDWQMISWRYIIAGVVVSLAVSILMGTLGVALGFTVVKPTSNSPLSGLGTTFGIWSVVSVLVSLAAGGFVAGLFSATRGAAHGFMVWCTVLLAATAFSGIALGAAVKTMGSVMRGVGSGAASVAGAGAMGDGVSHLASSAVDAIKENVSFDVDTSELRGDVADVLRDSGVKELQPEYLCDQMREARSDLRGAISRLKLDNGNFEQVLNEFMDKQKQRLETITGNVDKDAAVAALMKSRGWERGEAEKAVDNAMAAYNQVVRRAEEAVDQAHAHIDATKAQLQQAVAQARVRMEDMSRSAAKSALAAALALVLGALVCSYAGLYGSRISHRDVLVIEQRRGVEIPIDTSDVRTRFDRP